MEQKKNLLLDIDDVFCFPGFLDAINDFLGSNYVIDDFTEYYMEKEVIPDERLSEFNQFLDKRNLYENAQILPYAKEVLQDLNWFYNIYPCTSCINPFNILGSSRLFADKYTFLIHTMPFINPENYIFTNAKYLCNADIHIDDRLSNLHDGIETRILFPAYHNKKIQNDELLKLGILRAGYDWQTGWPEVANILLDSSAIKNNEIKSMKKSRILK